MSVYRVSDIERSISRPHVSHSDEKDVNKGPDAQSSETEELSQSFSPLTQIETVGSKPTQSDAVWKRRWNNKHLTNHIHIKYTVVFKPLDKTAGEWFHIHKFCIKRIKMYVKVILNFHLYFGVFIDSMDYLSVRAVDHLYPPVQLQKRRFWNSLFPVHNRQMF